MSYFKELLERATDHGNTGTTQFLIKSFYSMANYGVKVELIEFSNLDQTGQKLFNDICSFRASVGWSDSQIHTVSSELAKLGFPRESYTK